ncbi:SpaA isopeptide-forming pilin-related protein [Qiania dongpingensis]|uniref:Uncharacterized protein n=1 Tax=Qiania dongpingensis TaxID=2763669 RepID=A0A7G9G5Z9_9FIRM|nr:SpaA isopeptide-forming pilin-related protein [Qiania dongpingensis]QNM06231.1 hypothetical protein H9Q78_03505 [Qiania dongpingensis]
MKKTGMRKKRFLALFLALLIVLGMVVPSSYDLDSLAEGTAASSLESDSSETSAPETTASSTEESSTSAEQTTEESGTAATKTTEPETGISSDSASLFAEKGAGEAILTLTTGINTAHQGYVVSGEKMTLNLSFTVPPLSSGENYNAGIVQIELPEGVTVGQLEGASIFEKTEQIGTTYLMTLSSLESGRAYEASLPIQTENFTLENNSTLNFPTVFRASYKVDGEDQPRQMEIESTPSITVKATDGWRVEKSVETKDGEAVINKVTDGGTQYYEVKYTIDAINQMSENPTEEEMKQTVWNREGRLDFAQSEGKPVFSLVDELPANTPAGGGATVVSVATAGRGVLREGTDYVVNKNGAGEASSIEFASLDQLKETDPDEYQYVNDGAYIDTKYTVVLRYPVSAYQSSADEDLLTWTLQNTAKLHYQLIGENPVDKSADAQIILGEYDDNTESADIVVEKWIQVGTMEKLLDASASSDYGTAAFGLYKTETGAAVANDIHNKAVGNPKVTGSNGQVVFSGLLVGKSYYLEEVSAPDGFGSATAAGRVKITVNQDKSITVENAPEGVEVSSGIIKVTDRTDILGRLEFYKYGKNASGATAPMEGVTFTLTSKTEPSRTFEAVSGEDGYVCFEAVPAGDYMLSETALPAGAEPEYELGAPREVTVAADTVNHPSWSDEGSTAEKPVFLNQSHYGYLTIIKKDEDTDQQGKDILLSGAKFGIYTDEECLTAATDTSGAEVILVTDGQGKAASPMLPAGNYWLKELEAPDEYVLDPTAIPVTVVEQTTVEKSLTNVKKVPLVINKIGVLSGTTSGTPYKEQLKDAEFNIYDAETGGNLLGTLVTYLDPTGHSVSKIKGTENEQLLLPAGTYWYEEIAAPAGYTQISGRHEISISKGNSETTVENTTIFGQIRIRKTDAADSSRNLSGAVFEIYDNEICSGTPVGTITTDGSGYGLSPILPVGKAYYLKEVTAPAGYSVLTEVIKGTDASGNGTADGNGIFVAENAQTDVIVSNAEKVSIRVIKKDSVSGGVIRNVSFGLYSGVACTEDDLLQRKSTDVNGLCVFEDLEAGVTYYVKELSTPDGYVPDDTVYPVTTPEASSTVKSVEQVVKNVRLGKLNLLKTSTMDNGNTPMQGVKFGLYEAVSNGSGGYTAGAQIKGLGGMDADGFVTTDGDGRASIDGIIPGTYVLKEQSVAGYPEKEQVVTVVAGQNQNVSGGGVYPSGDTEVVNVPSMGKLKLKKISSLNPDTALTAEFKLYAEKDSTKGNDALADADREYEDTEKAALTTVNGVVTSGWLNPGKYKLVETGTAEGYVLDSAPKYVTITAGETNTEYFDAPVANVPKGRLVIHKTAEMDGAGSNYRGASFSLYKVVNDNETDYASDKTAAATAVTGADGKASMDNLDPGEYWLVEAVIENYHGFTPVKVTIQAGQNRTDLGGSAVTDTQVVNRPSKGKVKLKKVDSTDPSKGLSAVFELYPETEATSGDVSLADENRIYSSISAAELTTSASDGTALSGWLAPGRYKVVESSVSGNYVKDPEPKYITVEEGKTNTVLFDDPVENVPMGRISIKKTARFNLSGDGVSAGSFSRYDLTGSVFKIYAKTADNTDAEGKCIKSALGNALDTVDMTASATGLSAYLAPGEYWVVEDTAPSGYQTAAPVAVTVTSNTTTAADSHPGEAGAAASIDNTTDKGRLRFYKYSRNTNTLLDGAQFELYILDNGAGTEYTLDDGTVVKLRKIEKSSSTDASGIMESGTSGKGSAVTVDLEPGTYYLRETSLDSVKQSTGISSWKWEKEWTGPVEVTSGNEVVAPKIWNYYEVNGEGTKTDENGTALAGAYFAAFETAEAAQTALSYLDGMVLAGKLDEVRTQMSTPQGQATFMAAYNAADIAASGSDGTFKFTRLAPGGTYYIIEVAPPAGYGLPGAEDNLKQVTVKAGGGFNENLSYQDKKLGKLQVIKYTTLNGAAFAVEGVTVNVYRAVAADGGSYTAADGKTYNKKEETPIVWGTTGADGLYTSLLIPAGVYIVEEDISNLPDSVGAPDDLSDTYRIVVVSQGAVNDTYAQMMDGSGFKNPASYGKFLLKKVSSLNENTLVGATFKLYKKNPSTGAFDVPVQVKDAGGSLTDYIITTSTDAKAPVVESIYLEPGEYELVEQTVNGRYTLDSTPIPVTIRAGEITGAGNASVTDKNSPLVAENVPQGTLSLEKLGAFGDVKEGLKGVTFKLYKRTAANTDSYGNIADETINMDGLSDTDKVKDITTGNNGKVTVTGIDGGRYWLVETGVGANYHYQLSTPAYSAGVVITPGQTVSLTGENAVVNDINAGKFKLNKIFSSGSTNASFKVEKKVDDGAGNVTYRNAKKGWDSTKKEYTYSAYTFTTSGSYTSEYLEPGVYRITETGTTSGDYKLAEPFEVTIVAGAVTTAADTKPEGISDGADAILITNIKQGSLELEKQGIFMGSKIENLSGVTFELYEKTAENTNSDGSCKTDALGSPVTVKVNNADVTAIVTGTGGRVTASHIDPGEYWLKETDLGTHDDDGKYSLDGLVPMQVEITSGAVTKLTSDAGALGAVTNTVKYGKLQITKVDHHDHGTKLNGAVFSIHHLADCSDASLGSLTTAGQGTAISGLLPAGTYYLKEESAPSGYQASQEIWGPYTVLENQITTADDSGNSMITNKKEFSIEVVKQDSDVASTLLDGAVFGLYDSQADAEADAADLNGGGSASRFIQSKTTSGGKAVFSGLTIDAYDDASHGPASSQTYYLVELTPPSGYAADYTVRPVVVAYSGSVTKVTENVTNEALGKIRLKKVVTWDGATRNLGDVGFSFYPVSGEGVTHAAGAVPADTKTTDINGELTTTSLPAGYYEVVETSTPDGYQASAVSRWVLVENKKINETLYNTPITNVPVKGDFKLEKIASDGSSVGGAKFYFYKETTPGNYELADPSKPTFTVEYKDGKAIYTSGMLEPGNYKIVEAEAPSKDGVDFTVSAEERYITITAGTTQDLTGDNAFKNYPKMSIVLTKKGDVKNGSPLLPGAKFQLYADSDLKTEVGDPVMTGDQGTATWTGIDAGTYYIKEIEAPDGYGVTAEAKMIVVPKVSRLTDLVVNFGDWTDEANAGRLLIRKTDVDGSQMLSGAKFNIYGDNGSGSYTVLMNEAPLTTDGTGTALSGLLPAEAFGTQYRVVEVKAPDGYTLDDVFEPISQMVTVYPDHTPVYEASGLNENVVTFRNKTQGSIGQFSSDVKKEIKDSDEAYTTGTVNADESLLLSGYTVNFRVTGLSKGTNDLPADSFTVTDENIKLYTIDRTGGGIQYVEKSADDRDYTIDQVVIHAASNQDASEKVTAELQYKTSLGSGQWLTKISGLDLTGSQTVDLSGDHAAAIRIVYGNVQAGFKAEAGFEMQVTFVKREGDMIGADIPEVRRITNTAAINWAYQYKDAEGNEKPQSGSDESNEVEALIPASTSVLPQVKLTNKITNMKQSGVFYTGQSVNFQVDVVNVQNIDNNAPNFKAPMVAVDLPAYTSLDTDGTGNGFTIYQTKLVNGVAQKVELKLGDDYTLQEEETAAVIGMEGGTYVTSDSLKTKRYVFKFNEGVSLSPDTEAGENSGLTISYKAKIEYSKPTTQLNLYSPAFLSSTYLLPASQENPLGLSFTGYQASTQNNDELDDAVGSDLEYLNQPVGVTVLNDTQIQLVKTVSDSADTGFSTAQVNVYPNQNVYYDLTLYNNSDTAVRTARYVDILPFNGDSYVFRSGGGTTLRQTTIQNGAGYEEMLLEAVAAQDGNAVIYYFVEDGGSLANSWSYANRQNLSAEAELPMLYEASGDVWNAKNGGHWTTQKPSDMSLVTAVGVEVNFPESDLLQPGESYSVKLTMKTPGYTADKIEEYADAVMANSAAAAVLRSTETAINPTRDIVEPNKVLVGLSLPKGSIGDYAWYDFNNNGLQDDGEESAAANVKVELYQTTLTKHGDTVYRSDEVKIKEMNTDGMGHYLFENLPCNYLKDGAAEGSVDPNDYVGGTIYYYRVKFSIPADHAATLRYAGQDAEGAEYRTDSNIDTDGWTDYLVLRILNHEVDGRDVIYGEENLDVDAGYVVSVALGDKVWIDEDHDGLQGPDEPGLPGVLVKLYQVDGTDSEVKDGAVPVDTAMTDVNGEYLFDKLPQGYYVVEFDVRALTTDGYTYRYAFTAPDVTDSKLTTPDDSDAVYPADETGRVKRTTVIPLFFDQNEEIEQAGNKTDRTWDAGVWVYSALGGYAFEDKNYSNYQDITTDKMDGPLPGTVVKLYKVEDGIRQDTALREAIVGDDGRYFFDELEAGQYQVFFQFPDGYTAVESPDGVKNPDTNLSDTDDSDCCIFENGDYTKGYTEIITLGYNTVDKTWDAGANKKGALGDYVWFDTDKDGIQDEDEEPIADVTVKLQYRMGDDDEWKIYPGGVTKTDENGRYLFTGLKGGEDYPIQYRVVFDFDDPNTTITITNSRTDKQGDRSVSLTEGEAAERDSDALGFYISNLGYVTTTITLGYGETDLTWDAGVVKTTCGMGDFVWYDKNRNGIQDEGETGVGGIPVVLEMNPTGELDNEEAWVIVGTTTTNESGYYRFLDLDKGYYRVRFQISDPYIVTLYNQGNGDNAYEYDSDATRLAGDDWYYSRIFYLEDNQYDWSWDAGLYLKSDIPTVTVKQYNKGPKKVITTYRTVFTGDNMDIFLWSLLASAAVVAIGVILYEKRRKRKQAEEQD